MKRIRTWAFALAGLVAAAAAIAQQKAPDSLERRLERIEQALARLEAKSSSDRGRGMMQNCREMMGGSEPNQQWRKPDSAK